MVSVRYTLVFTDPLLGHCEAALLNVSGPLLNPTVEAMRDHLEEAFRRASEARASLFVAFIGHGRVAVEGPGQVGFDDYYLLPSDCPNPEQPRLRTAWRVGEELRELLRDHPDLDGLVFLIDACQSGQPQSRWPPGLRRSLRRRGPGLKLSPPPTTGRRRTAVSPSR